MPKYNTKYGVVTLGPGFKQFHLEPAANMPAEPRLDTDGLDEELPVEAFLYVIMQKKYHLMSLQLRQTVARHFKKKKMRDTIISQANLLPDGPIKNLILYECSPPLYPDLPNAPPDLPQYATLLLAVMEEIAQRDGLETATLRGPAEIPPERVWACYGLETPESVKKIKADAFAEGAAYARQLHADLLEDDRKREVEELAAPPKDSDYSVYGTTRALLRQAIAKRALDDAEEEAKDSGRPSKRARYNYDSSDESSDDSSVRAPSLDLDMDVDMDEAYNPQDAGAGTGMLPAPRAYIDSYSAKQSRPRNWERLWHELPYETRIHKLGPGMTRQNVLPDDEFALPLRPAAQPARRVAEAKATANAKTKTNLNTQAPDPPARVAIYKGKGVKPRFATLDEAKRQAPDDYEDCHDIFDWEVEHGRAAPAVPPHNQKLPFVPFHAGSRLRPTTAHDPTEPADSRRPLDDNWDNTVTQLDPETGTIVTVMVQPDGTQKIVARAPAAKPGSPPKAARADNRDRKKTARAVDDGDGGGDGGKRLVNVGGILNIGYDGIGVGDGDGYDGEDESDESDDADDKMNSGLPRLLHVGSDITAWLWKKAYAGRRLDAN